MVVALHRVVGTATGADLFGGEVDRQVAAEADGPAGEVVDSVDSEGEVLVVVVRVEAGKYKKKLDKLDWNKKRLSLKTKKNTEQPSFMSYTENRSIE